MLGVEPVAECVGHYIVCHYRMNQRGGSEYWRANAENQHLSDNLKAVITSWFTGGELDEEVHRLGIGRYYAPLSWHCLLAGYGQFPDDARITAAEPGMPQADLARIDRFVSACARNFPPHDEVLRRLGQGQA